MGFNKNIKQKYDNKNFFFQRQQTCPTCRLDILSPGAAANLAQRPIGGAAAANQQRPGPAAGAAHQAPPPTPQAQAARPAGQPQPAAMPNFPMFPPAFAQVAAAGRMAGQDGAAAAQAFAAGGGAANPMAGLPGGFPGMLPPMFPPFVLPFPPAPAFAGLTDDEVRHMEGRERVAVQARIQCLRNIQTLLDAASIQLQQYLSIMATVG